MGGFLHTAKRLMITLVSFCKRIQCLNEIELNKKTNDRMNQFVWYITPHPKFFFYKHTHSGQKPRAFDTETIHKIFQNEIEYFSKVVVQVIVI